MARLPPFKRLLIQDFPSKYVDLLSKLLYGINQFFESTVNALDHNLTFEENMSAQVKELIVTAPVTNVEFRSTLRGLCRGVWVIEAKNITDNGSLLTSAPFVEFTNGEESIIITNITGLTTGKQYRLRVVCITGLS